MAILYNRVDCDFAISVGRAHPPRRAEGTHGRREGDVHDVGGAQECGPYRIANVLQDLQRWMEEHEYESVKQMQGSMSQQNTQGARPRSSAPIT